jgi:hypothetical protein
MDSSGMSPMFGLSQFLNALSQMPSVEDLLDPFLAGQPFPPGTVPPFAVEAIGPVFGPVDFLKLRPSIPIGG